MKLGRGQRISQALECLLFFASYPHTPDSPQRVRIALNWTNSLTLV